MPFTAKIYMTKETPWEKYLESIYRAYTVYNRAVLEEIIATAPKARIGTAAYPRGWLARHFKLIPREEHGIKFYEVGIPGAKTKGTSGWRAWVVTMALHFGWKKLPFVRRPVTKRAMAFRKPEAEPGQEKPGKLVVIKKAVQRRQIKKNPWVKRAYMKKLGVFHKALAAEGVKFHHKAKDLELMRL